MSRAVEDLKVKIEVEEPREEGPQLSVDEQLNRANSILEIGEVSDFQPKPFISGVDETETMINKTKVKIELLNEGDVEESSAIKWQENPKLLLHPRLYEDPQTKKGTLDTKAVGFETKKVEQNRTGLIIYVRSEHNFFCHY